MAILLDGGLTKLLTRQIAGPLTVRLFRNNVLVSISSLIGDFTQATFPGYTDILVQPLLSSPILDSVGRAVTSSSALTWTRGAGGVPELIYGWILFEDVPLNQRAVAGENFAPPKQMSLAGQIIVLTLLGFLQRG